jgi:multiple sugar transport system substrate-binding protein
MLATASAYEDTHDVAIEWVPRSLKDFGMMSVQELAADFDLIVIDHPHVGVMAEAGCVVPIDELAPPGSLDALGASSPGRSHDSYRWRGHQWALAIDAACQTSAWRPDLLPEPPRTVAEVVELSRSGRVLWPLCDVDSAASFMSLAAAAGAPCGRASDRFADRDVGRFALETMRAVAQASEPRCLQMNPIDVLEAMARTDDFVYSPLIFCYASYSRRDHEGARVAFGDNPTISPAEAPRGSLLGGAGLAISASRPHAAAALDYALYVADPQTQRGLYFSAGGQPAHHAAWVDPTVDHESGGFFSGVTPTITGSWTRPRGPGFAAFQNAMIELFGTWFARAGDPDTFLDDLERLWTGTASEGATESGP